MAAVKKPQPAKRGTRREAMPRDAGDFFAAVPATELRDNGAEIVGRVAHTSEPVVLTRFGKPVAAIVSLEALDLIRRLEDEVDAEAAKSALREIAKHGTISLEEVKARLGI